MRNRIHYKVIGGTNPFSLSEIGKTTAAAKEGGG